MLSEEGDEGQNGALVRVVAGVGLGVPDQVQLAMHEGGHLVHAAVDVVVGV